jgi:hypothetical protein
MPRLFLSQAGLESWLQDGSAQLLEDRLSLESGEVYRLVPAVHFLRQVAGDGDPLSLVGKVKTEPQLLGMEAEHSADSVILGETGYQVEEGFVGEPVHL